MPLPPLPPLPAPSYDQTILGNLFAETLPGAALADYIFGDGGNDLLIGGDGNDYLDGGDGNDTLQGGRDADVLIGGTGNDVIAGSSGNDSLFGGDGNDTLTSGGQTSLLVGGAGDDVLGARLLSGGDHVLYGGDGMDIFDLIQTADSSISELQFGDFELGVDTFRVDGVAGAAVLNAGAYLVVTNLGMRLTLTSGDIIHFDGLNDLEDFTDTYALGGNDIIIGGTANDRIFGGAGNNNLDGADGNDLVVGGEFNDTIYGGNGNDNLNARRGNDWVYGGDGDDRIYGNIGTEMLFGEEGDDFLNSGRDSSLVNGGAGNDVLLAKIDVGGDHTLIGGSGADSFELLAPVARRNAHTVIADFEFEGDAVSIGGQWLGDYIAFNGLSFVDTVAGARVSLAGGAGSITFADHSAYDLSMYFGYIEIIS